MPLNDAVAGGAYKDTEALLPVVQDGSKANYEEMADAITLEEAGELINNVDEETESTPIVTPDGTTSEWQDYTFDGWASVFPFCIPFDLVNCIRVLSVTGKAPKWVFPFEIARFGIYEEIVIDLEKWDSVALICRYFETLAFIMALVVKTRSLIRG